MAAKGLWKSSDTPDRTLNSAISREIAKKGGAVQEGGEGVDCAARLFGCDPLNLCFHSRGDVST